MFVFDTNVLSEVMKAQPHPNVSDWLRSCSPDLMFTTAISRSELFYGIWRLPDGKRRRSFEQAAHSLFEQEFSERILPFNSQAADAYADLRIRRERAGSPISTEDGMIAAITKLNSGTVVTRDIGGFANCGVPHINPWSN